MILLILFSVLAVIAVISIILVFGVEFREVKSPVKVLNPEGKVGATLVVYQKGLRDFQPKIAYGFAKGLVSTGWWRLLR